MYPADPINKTDLDGTMQRCSNAIDATGFGGVGLATLIRQGDGKYNLQITVFDHFLAQFSATTFSVGYSVNGPTARGQYAGDGKFRSAYDDIHSRQVVQGRKYRDGGFWSRKQHTVRSGDVLRLKINIYYYDPVSFRSFSVRGSLTCQV